MQVTEHFDTIVIGGGAAGLMATSILTRVKVKTLLLEAQDKIGGRMCTIVPQNFTDYIESGAEFIHGEAPITLEILKEADISYVEMEGNIYQAHEENIEKEDFFDEEWSKVLQALKSLKHDMTMSEFLLTHFSGKEKVMMREKVIRFVEGYNAADAAKVSSFSLRDEWSEEEDPAQNRITGGYKKLYDELERRIVAQDGHLRLSTPVTHVNWKPGHVEVVSGDQVFTASTCLVTLPVSLLKSESIKFHPGLPSIVKAADKIGFGSVIKINLEFHKAFWETETKRKFKNIQFLFTDEVIPTWWSQYPDTRPLLTGWLAGPRAEQITTSEEQIVQMAITSLAKVMDVSERKVKQELRATHVTHWLQNEYSRGAYSYEMIGASDAVRELQKPVHNTIFFSGEAIYTGPHKGTVEAALTSGKEAAEKILALNLFELSGRK